MLNAPVPSVVDVATVCHAVVPPALHCNSVGAYVTTGFVVPVAVPC
jgi:hypothetical protein